MTSPNGRARECPLVPGRVCPDECNGYTQAQEVRKTAEEYLEVVEGLDPHNQPAMGKGRECYLGELNYYEQTLPPEKRRLPLCDQYNKGRR